MGFLSRRPRPVETTTTTAAPAAPGTHEKRGFFSRAPAAGHHSSGHHAHPDYYNLRPSFGQWLKGIWLDILTMAVMGAIGLGVYRADPAPSRSFPLTFQDGEIIYPEFAYPMRPEIIAIWKAAMIASLVPICVFLIFQIRIRSFWDLNNAIVGLLYSLITAAVFQVFIKWLIGGLRPHFYEACQPKIPENMMPQGNGWRQIMFQRDICTGDKKEINDSLESMPSGHATAAFAGLIYLYIYIQAKLKIFSNHHPAMWKLVATYAPVLGAVLIAGALTIDEFHNWYDLVAGGAIGSMMAFSSYRMVYASVWDFRFNHIPLNRNIPFTYGQDQMGFGDAVFTRRAGWGLDIEAGTGGGAPFDAGSWGGAGGAGVRHHRAGSGGHHHHRRSLSGGHARTNGAAPVV